MKLLLVEDDLSIAEMLTEALIDNHYVVELAHDGQTAIDLVKAFSYDLLLLDVMLPQMDGISVCRKLRANGYLMPILMLTAKDTTKDRVTGLDAGADDYVTKPYNLQELLARIRALLRRGQSSIAPIMEWGDLTLDPSSCEVTYQKKPLTLTPKEYRLMELFLRHGSRVLSRSTIVENLWSYEETPQEDAVKAHIKRLRQKLKNAGASSDLIETVYGLGYRLKQNS
ncbi:MAG: response regulator transcription factor [Prochloraceae cyanobacterium]